MMYRSKISKAASRRVLACALLLLAGSAIADSSGALVAPAHGPGEKLVGFTEMKQPDGSRLVYRSIQVADPDHEGQTIVIDQVLRRSGPGELQFVRGAQPKESSVYRQKVCASMGGLDITNDVEATIDENALNFALCGHEAPNDKIEASVRAAANDPGITIVLPPLTERVAQTPWWTEAAVWISSSWQGNNRIYFNVQGSYCPNLRYIEDLGVPPSVRYYQPVISCTTPIAGDYTITVTACGAVAGTTCKTATSALHVTLPKPH